MNKVAEYADSDSNLAFDQPIIAIRGMCPGISTDMPNDAEHIPNTDDAERTREGAGSPTTPSTQ